MKKITYLLVILLTQIGFSQKHECEFEQMVEAEMKSASKKLDFAANSNTLNYDITYHKLEFTVNPTVSAISGIVTTTYTALENMNTVTFDLTDQLVVSSVKQDITSLSFIQNANYELIITLPATQLSGTSNTIEITYSGTPSNSGFSSFMTGTHNGSPILWTLSEPYGARDWWPCKQDLNDKVNSIDVYITAPSSYVSVSNGLEQSQTINGVNKTTHFHHNYPIPAYLIAIAVSNYNIHNQQGGLGTVQSPYFPIVNYIYPETAIGSMASLAITPTIINFFESIIGDYPFRNEKYGHAQFGWGGGMEHTTVSFMANFNRGLIAHEMAHQWFGDKITCGTWKDIWLNEGITEYMSGLVTQNLDGENAFISWKVNKINSITSAATGNLYLYDSQLSDVGRIFDGRLTYSKGSMVTNMLRFKMGNANFFQALRNYLNDPLLAYAYAVTPQFQAHLEAVYGSSLQEFFDDWVYKEGYPTYAITAHNSGSGQATIQINQTQSITNPAQTGYVSFFEMPVPVRLLGSGGQTHDVVLNNTFNGQTFNVSVPFTVTGVLFDPNKDIISRNSTATLGIDQITFEEPIRVFPNPIVNDLTIEIPSNVTLEKVTFYNILGQKSLETNQTKVDVSKLQTGVYVVTFQTSTGTFHKKMVKN